MKPPEWMLEPAFEEFKQEFEARAIHGTNVLSQSAVAIVGLARNCGRSLPANLHRASMLSKGVSFWGSEKASSSRIFPARLQK
jgi:hypothetical protein